METLPPTHYFPSPARRLSMREKQVHTSIQPLEDSRYNCNPFSKCMFLAAMFVPRLCLQLHLGAGERQLSPSRSEITTITVPQSLSSLEGPELSCSSTEMSWESWPSSKPFTSTVGGALGSVRPLSRYVCECVVSPAVDDAPCNSSLTQHDPVWAHVLLLHACRLVQRFRTAPPLSREERQAQDELCGTTTASPDEPIIANRPLPQQAGKVEGASSSAQSEGSSSEMAPTASTQSRMPRVSSPSESGSDNSIAERAEQLISDRCATVTGNIIGYKYHLNRP